MGWKKQINARLPNNLQELIAQRAAEIGETQGGYLALIAKWWFEQGGPPINAYEACVLATVNERKNPREAESSEAAG